MISAARELQIHHDKVRTVVAIDPQATNSDESDETGIVAASSYGSGDKKFSVDGDYSGKYSPAGWAKKAISAYEQHEADAIVIETNRGGYGGGDTTQRRVQGSHHSCPCQQR